MSNSDPSVASTTAHINVDSPATFRKWPSLNGQRRVDSIGPYLLLDATLDECIREFLAKPTVTRHLYEIHTSPQAPFVGRGSVGRERCRTCTPARFFRSRRNGSHAAGCRKPREREWLRSAFRALTSAGLFLRNCSIPKAAFACR